MSRRSQRDRFRDELLILGCRDGDADAFRAGDEPYRPDPGREALEASVVKFETRVRTVRFMTIVIVTFATAVFATGLVVFPRSGDEATVRGNSCTPASSSSD